MKAITIGIDLAKNVFQIHGVDGHGKVVMKKQVKREQMAVFFANLPAALIGMEACGSAHYWARKLQGMGHTVRLMAPQFVKPYVKANKNDAADAEAICEAVTRPNMRFVPVKTVEQQAVLALHRARQGFVRARTAQANQIRGLLNEYGIVIPQGIAHIAEQVPDIIEDGTNVLPGYQTQPGSQLPAIVEVLRVADRCHQCCCGNRPDARYLLELAAQIALSVPCPDRSIHVEDLSVKHPEVVHEALH
jgi:transposase